MKILTLNCQKGYRPEIKSFLGKILGAEDYDFLLLQEASSPVIAMIKELNSSYKILDAFDEALGENSHVCILYKNKFDLAGNFFISFADFWGGKTPKGFLLGNFSEGGKNICIGSAHLHSGLKPKIRMDELKIIKGKLLEYKNENCPTVFGGDFNTGFPGEISKSEKILSPEFIRVSKNLGTTLDSRYTENANHIANRTAVFLAKFGIGIKLRTDHIYADSTLAKTKTFSCKILPDRVSDHNPVECNF